MEGDHGDPHRVIWRTFRGERKVEAPKPVSEEQGLQLLGHYEGRTLCPVPTPALEKAAAFLGLRAPWGAFCPEIVAC